MILAGHSFGGYMAAAYCERYPDRVERLILISPLGVPDEKDPSVRTRMESFQSSLRGRAYLTLLQGFFEMTTPGRVLRAFNERRGYGMAQSYVQRRLPEITDSDESNAVADYLYFNAALPGSGENFLQSFLNNNMLAKKPLLFRIPNLKIKAVTFMYGATDWMDISGGTYTQGLCEKLTAEREEQQDELSSSSILNKDDDDDGILSSPPLPPKVNVFLVPKAGHLLILQNPRATNACIIRAAGGNLTISSKGEEKEEELMPLLMKADENEEMNDDWLQQTRMAKEDIGVGFPSCGLCECIQPP